MKRNILIPSLICVLGFATTLFAQDPGGDEGGGRGGRGGRRFDPAQMEARILQHYKEQLQVGDEEWTVIEPMLKDVMAKQRAERDLRGGRRRMWGGNSEQATEVAALETALEQNDAEAIKTAVTALRAARATKAAELKAAQDKLREVLTVAQEARLILSGMLD